MTSGTDGAAGPTQTCSIRAAAGWRVERVMKQKGGEVSECRMDGLRDGGSTVVPLSYIGRMRRLPTVAVNNTENRQMITNELRQQYNSLPIQCTTRPHTYTFYHAACLPVSRCLPSIHATTAATATHSRASSACFFLLYLKSASARYQRHLAMIAYLFVPSH